MAIPKEPPDLAVHRPLAALSAWRSALYACHPGLRPPPRPAPATAAGPPASWWAPTAGPKRSLVKGAQRSFDPKPRSRRSAPPRTTTAAPLSRWATAASRSLWPRTSSPTRRHQPTASSSGAPWSAPTVSPNGTDDGQGVLRMPSLRAWAEANPLIRQGVSSVRGQQSAITAPTWRRQRHKQRHNCRQIFRSHDASSSSSGRGSIVTQASSSSPAVPGITTAAGMAAQASFPATVACSHGGGASGMWSRQTKAPVATTPAAATRGQSGSKPDRRPAAQRFPDH